MSGSDFGRWQDDYEPEPYVAEVIQCAGCGIWIEDSGDRECSDCAGEAWDRGQEPDERAAYMESLRQRAEVTRSLLRRLRAVAA